MSRHWPVSQKHSDYTETVHTSCPSTFELLALCSVGAGVGQRLLPRTRRGGFVALSFPSFTYLTAAALSYVVFPFTFYVSFDPIRAVDHRDSLRRWISLTPPIGTPCFHFDGFWLRLFGGIMLDVDTQITRWRSSTNCCRTVCVFVCMYVCVCVCVSRRVAWGEGWHPSPVGLVGWM